MNKSRMFFWEDMICNEIIKKVMKHGFLSASEKEWLLIEQHNKHVDESPNIPQVIQDFRLDCYELGIYFKTWKEIFEAYEESK